MNGTTKAAVALGIVAILTSLCVYAADSTPLRYVDGRTVHLDDLDCTLDGAHGAYIDHELGTGTAEMVLDLDADDGTLVMRVSVEGDLHIIGMRFVHDITGTRITGSDTDYRISSGHDDHTLVSHMDGGGSGHTVWTFDDPGLLDGHHSVGIALVFGLDGTSGPVGFDTEWTLEVVENGELNTYTGTVMATIVQSA